MLACGGFPGTAAKLGTRQRSHHRYGSGAEGRCGGGPGKNPTADVRFQESGSGCAERNLASSRLSLLSG